MVQEQSVLPVASNLLELASRPAQVIEHQRWTTARETALALVTAGPCLVLLLGPPGSGKTTLLRNLATTVGQRGRTACLLDFGDSQLDAGSADIVLVDEADRMSAARLDELTRHHRCAIVLAALPSAGERFRRYPGVTVVRLAALSPDQARAFLAERLAQLGLPTGCLTEAAWARLIAHGHGVPRLLIALLGLALFVAAGEDATRITGAHVEHAVEVRGGDAEGSQVEPIPAPPDPDRRGVPEFLAADRSADTGTDRDVGKPGRRRTTVAAALTAVCLFAAAAALLTWGGSRHGDPTASPEPAAPVAAGVGGAVSVATSTQPVGSASSTTSASVPVPVAPAPAASPAPPPSAAPLPVSAATEPNQTASPPAVPPAAAPPPAAAGTAPDLPSGALIHVVLIYPRGDPAAAQRGLDLARVLRSDGLGVGDPFPVAARESNRGISYYFDQDEDAATEIGRRLGGEYGEGKLVRLPPGAGLPRPGTIEIAVGSN